jgi:putative ABC transport system ATP-binding protein
MSEPTAATGTDEAMQPASAASDGVPLIRLRSVTKVYGVGATALSALKGVDMDVQAGDFVAIMGPSGSGKSTAMNVLGCLDTPSAGEYLFQGVHVESLTRDQRARLRRRYLGFVFQGFNLLARTSALKNVELPMLYDRSGKKRDTRALATAALQRVGLGERLDHLPSELSGGQQQRVAIARALVTEPALVLADEPTGNLDTHTTMEVMALFQELNQQGITIVLVTHEPDVAVYATRIIQVQDGQIVREEPVADRHDAVRDLAERDTRAA